MIARGSDLSKFGSLNPRLAGVELRERGI